MKPIKLTSTNHIPYEFLSYCQIDKKPISEILKIYSYADVENFLKQRATCIYAKFILYIWDKYHLTLPEYFQKLGYQWPKCSITGLPLNYTFRSSNKDLGLKINKFHDSAVITKNNSPKFAAFCERLSKERMGKNNPAYGLDPWNKNLTKTTDSRLKSISHKLTGRKMSETAKQKMREARAKSPIKARHTTPHSPETILKLKEHTAKLHSTGVFKKVTSIHSKMKDYLNKLSLKESYEEEYQIKYYSVDFAFPKNKIVVECDGDYFHCNPKFYPNGPETTTQRRNFGRDKAKNKYLKKNGWKILRFWENEINSRIYEKKLLCKFKKLDLLDQ